MSAQINWKTSIYTFHEEEIIRFVITDHRPLFPSLYMQYVILNLVSGKCFRVYIINTYQNQFLTKWNWIATNFLKFIIRIVPFIYFFSFMWLHHISPSSMYVIKWSIHWHHFGLAICMMLDKLLYWCVPSINKFI